MPLSQHAPIAARRSLLFGLAATLATVVLGLAPFGSARANTVIAVVGDSLGVGLQDGLYHTAPKSARVIRASRPNTGLTRDFDYDWPARTAEVVKKYGVDTVVVFVGANDFQRMVIRKPGEKTRIHLRGSPEWLQVYRARVTSLIESALKAGAKRVVWVGMPIVRSSVMDRRYKILDEIYREAAAANEAVTHFPIRSLTARKTEAGEEAYTPYVTVEDRRRLFRNSKDGIHFTVIGYRYLAEHLWQSLTTEPASTKGN